MKATRRVTLDEIIDIGATLMRHDKPLWVGLMTPPINDTYMLLIVDINDRWSFSCTPDQQWVVCEIRQPGLVKVTGLEATRQAQGRLNLRFVEEVQVAEWLCGTLPGIGEMASVTFPQRRA